MESIRNAALQYSEANIRRYIDKTAHNVVQYLIEGNFSISTAESCTGGMLSSAITSVPGSSKIFECGVVSYSERIKEELLGVPAKTVKDCGVVSAETAMAMAMAVKRLSGSDISVGITGLAGPSSDESGQPVGTVYVAIAYKDRITAENLRLYELGDLGREANRLLTVGLALEAVEKEFGIA